MIKSYFVKEHENYAKHRAAHWDKLARRRSGMLTRHYRNRLAESYGHVAAGCERVLELGCGRGELLYALRPHEGIGVDFSEQMIVEAQRRYPNLHFIGGGAQIGPINVFAAWRGALPA